MSFCLTHHKIAAACMPPLLALSCLTSFAAMNPDFELDQKSLKSLTVQSKSSPNTEKKKRRSHSAKTFSKKAVAGNVYTVRSGDNLFKILMREYALSNDEAEALIEEIRRENNIYDIKKLKVGQKISIPPVARAVDGTLKGIKTTVNMEGSDSIAHGFRIEPPQSTALEQNTVEQIKGVWGQLVPANGLDKEPLKFESSTFSLILDPQRYPVLSSNDGARIIIDQGASIPPLVKTLIMAKDPKVRIVSESYSSQKQLLAAVLDSAGFYSVEQDFRLEFGTDPKLKVQSDFKIEKSADSLVKQDVTLLNSKKQALPAALGAFLKKEGFAVLEPFAIQQPSMSRTPMHPLLQLVSSKQHQVVDTLLESLLIPFQNQRNVDIFPLGKNGITLSVKVDRFFENSGNKHVVTSFDGDPITYTLFRILETTGYRVVILENKDDFRKVTEKLLASLQIPADYKTHKMWPDDGYDYSMQMSGFRLEGGNIPGGSMFLTDRPLDPIIRSLLQENGYEVKIK